MGSVGNLRGALPVSPVRPFRRPRRRDFAGHASGQALVFGLVTLAVVSALMLVVVLAVSIRMQARAALAAAVDAAAVAARQTSSGVTATLWVRFATHACRWSGATAVRTLRCDALEGGEVVQVASGDAFAGGAAFGFGPEPGWAAAAGCAGTLWHRPSGPGSWRICAGQSLQSAAPAAPDPAAALSAARAWLAANLAGQSLLTEGTITHLSIGGQGQVTVAAAARLRWPVLGAARISASATAWPGR